MAPVLSRGQDPASCGALTSRPSGALPRRPVVATSTVQDGSVTEPERTSQSGGSPAGEVQRMQAAVAAAESARPPPGPA